MKLYPITSAAVALAAVAVLATSARAQVYTPDPVPSGDVLIGFESYNSTTSAATPFDYVVDLGQVSQFINDTSTSPLQFQLSTTDLSSAFGTGWASNSNGSGNVQWGVVANDPSDSISSDPDGDSVWYTKGETVPGTQTTAPVRGSSSTLHAVSNAINNFEDGYAGQVATTSTSTTPYLGYIESSGAGSWTSAKPGAYSGNTAFGIGSEIEQPSTGSYTGPTDSVLDFYEVDTKTGSNEPATFLGTFSLAPDGILSFTGVAAQATPEPSAYALGLIAIALFVVLKRRKSISTLA